MGFPQLKPTNVYEDNTGCISSANNMILLRSKHIAVRVCVIQKLIQDWNVKRQGRPRSGTNCTHRDKGFCWRGH